MTQGDYSVGLALTPAHAALDLDQVVPALAGSVALR